MLSKDAIVDVDYRCRSVRSVVYVLIPLSITSNEILRYVFLSNSFGSGRTIVRPLHIFTYLLTYSIEQIPSWEVYSFQL